ncbi:hypothetical protein C8Q75DRAFT_735507 [Abortiporus biennis]|nr:hypothetical protein C8Q75DRAFT_735507 [Abortiporus biennis]
MAKSKTSPPASKGDTPPPTPLQQPSTPQGHKLSGFRSLSRKFLGGKSTKEKMRTMAGKEIDSRALEMDYKDFMSRFMKCQVDEEKETEEIDAIVKKIGRVPKILERTNVKESQRYLPLIQLIQPAWDGTDYVARNVCNYEEKSNLKIRRKPDIVCYKKNKDGATDFDLLNESAEQETPTGTTHTLDSSSLPSNNALSVNSSGPLDGTARLDESAPSGSLDRPIADVGPSLGGPVADSSDAVPPSETEEEKKEKKKPYPPFAARMSYTACKLTVEDKTSTKKSAFSMSGCSLKDLLPGGSERVDARGQIGEHSSLAMERQHRTHYFSVVTVGTEIRFIRWDRAGVIITTPIRFNKDLTSFIKFFYRFARMTPEDQGEDASILEPSVEDLKALDEFRINEVPELVTNHQEFFADAFVKNKPLFPIVKVHLDRIPPVSPSDDQSSDDQSPKDQSPKDSSAILRLLIGAPRTNTYSSFGRCTKGFIAFDLDEKRLKFIKDCWRYDGRTYHPELEVYKRFQERIKSTPYSKTNLAVAEGGGDVKDSRKRVQKTATDILLNSKRTKDQKKFLPQKHYRFLIRQVGTPLERYKESSRSLCAHVAEAMNGHGLAWDEAGVLHRDVSPENILIDEDPEGGSRRKPQGFLHDWDLCKYKEEIDSGPAQEIRSGTWPFVSALLLYYPNKQHDLADDLESFVHIIYWFCIRFHHHDLTPDEIAAELSTTYLHGHKVNGFDIGSKKKIKLMRSGQPFIDLNKSNKMVNKGLYVIAEKLAQYCKEHYDTVNFQALDAERARVLGMPTLQEAPPTKDASKDDSVDVDLAARWGVATLPDDDNDDESSDDETSPFSSHKLIISTFNAAVGKAKYWTVDDKLEDQFNKDVSQSMFDGGKHTHNSSQATGGKRSASTVFEDDGPSQKRSRTSGQTDDSASASTASTQSQETGSRKKLKVKGIRSIPMEPTVPEEEETGERGVSMDEETGDEGVFTNEKV